MHNMQHLCHTKSTIASPQPMMVTLGLLDILSLEWQTEFYLITQGQSQIFRIWTKINIYAERLQRQHEIGNLGVIILISLTLTADTEYKHHPHHPITQPSQAVDVVKATLCVLLALLSCPAGLFCIFIRISAH